MVEGGFTIRVNIAERYYPIRIERNEEEIIRKAAKKINETLLQYRMLYKDKDEQDYLAMTVLQYANKLIALESKQNIAPFVKGIKEVDEELGDYLLNEQKVL